MKEIYLDNAATTRPFKEVCEEMAQIAYEIYGNPSSLHKLGFEAEQKMKEAIRMIADCLKVKSEDIIITSGATEGDNMAIIGSAMAAKRKGKHLITSMGEHPGASQAFKYLEEQGFEVTYIKPDKQGVITHEALGEALRPDTILVSIMHVNNEIGTVQNLSELSKVIKSYNDKIVFHSDCTQSFGKIPVLPSRMGVDIISTSAHKFHGPRGIGFVYKNPKVRILPLIYGGGQQKGLRSGTENIPALSAMAKAAKLCCANMEANLKKVRETKEHFMDGLMALNEKLGYEACRFIVDNNDSVIPYILSVSFAPIRSEVLLHSLEEDGIYVSSGSACASNHPGISSVLTAIDTDTQNLDSTIRFSFSPETSLEDIDAVLEVLEKKLPVLKKFTRH